MSPAETRALLHTGAAIQAAVDAHVQLRAAGRRGWVAWTPEHPGIEAFGAIKGEAVERLGDAIRLLALQFPQPTPHPPGGSGRTAATGSSPFPEPAPPPGTPPARSVASGGRVAPAAPQP